MKKTKIPARLWGRIILAGNPNVGKSTLFNLLTGMSVHTGNWSGKTVTVSEGYGVHMNKKYIISDLPGISSLSHPDAEELSAFDAIINGDYDCCIIVADATNLSRSLALTLRILEITPRCVLCVNLCDEAEKNGIKIDSAALEFILGIPVVLCSASRGKGIAKLMEECDNIINGNVNNFRFTPLYSPDVEDYLASFSYDRNQTITKLYFTEDYAPIKKDMALTIASLSAKISRVTVTHTQRKALSYKADRILCSPIFGIPVMLFMLAFILYITIVFSNYPSSFLSDVFKSGEVWLLRAFSLFPIPSFIANLLIYGVYSTTTTVIAVMLPPMAIFFPLFTLLEDFGFLPRVAFNLDNAFKKCGSCGKQALTMCMGLGCNCVGITGSAIIPSKREKLISILTNSFTPCNGRFGAIIAVITLFFASGSPLVAALVMLLVLSFSFLTTFLSSTLLSKTILKGEKSGFILELPPYRRPPVIKVIIRSLFERTFSVLLRAIGVAAPIGALIYVLNYFNLLLPIADFLNPLGILMGLDGVILLSFILALPANEIVFPIVLMLYTHSAFMVDNTSLLSLQSVLSSNGWSISTAVSFVIFTLMHWPCATALVAVKKETDSFKWTLLSILLPLLFGVFFCILSNLLFSLFGV